jgi:hypothetical protein
MPISKEEDKIHKALMKSQEKIINKLAQIEIEMHKHHAIHGGAIGFVDAFKKLGNTIKSGFEDKIINPIENKIINPIKENIPKSEKDILDKIPDKIKNDPKLAKAIDYITKKKGGLASSLLYNALPATTSAIVGGLSGLASGNPFVGMAGSAAGGYAGKELADYVGKKTGVGLRKKKGKGMSGCGNPQEEIKRLKEEADRGGDGAQSAIGKLRINGIKYTPKKQQASGGGMRGCGENYPDKVKRLKEKADSGGMGQQSAVGQLQMMGVKYTPKKQTDVPINEVNKIPQASGGRIRKKRSKKYYSSSSSDSDSDFKPKRRTNNSALQQLLVANRDKEEKELKKSQLLINRHVAEEIKAIRDLRPVDQRPLQKFSPYPVQGGAIKKLVGTKRGNRARGDIVAEVMKKEGLSLSQASKYVKEHDLY